MTKYTANEIALILGLEQTVLIDLKNNFNTYDEDKKYKTLEILWDSLYELHDKLKMVKYKQFLQEVEDGKRKLTTNIMNEAKAAVWKDFDDIIAGKPQDTKQMDELRNRLKSLTQNNTPLKLKQN